MKHRKQETQNKAGASAGEDNPQGKASILYKARWAGHMTALHCDKNPAGLSAGRSCTLTSQLTSSCSNSSVWREPPTESAVANRQKSEATRCNDLSLQPQQGLKGIAGAAPMSGTSPVRGLPLPCRHHRHRYKKQTNKQTKSNYMKSNWKEDALWLFSVGFFFPLPWSDSTTSSSTFLSQVWFHLRESVLQIIPD